jgi:uncharacterized protein (TIGR02099 family)
VRHAKIALTFLHFHARWISGHAWPWVAAAIITLALLGAGLRLWLPSLQSYRPDVEAWLGATLGGPVSIGTLSGTWYGWAPQIRVQDLRLLDDAGQPRVRFREAMLRVDALGSLLTASLKPRRLTISGVSLSLLRSADGRFHIQGLETRSDAVSAELTTALLNQARLDITDADILWQDQMANMPSVSLTDVSMRLRNSAERHQLEGEASVAGRPGERIEFAINGLGDPTGLEWDAEVYLASRGLRLAPLVAPYLSPALTLSGAEVETRLWGTWRDARLATVTGDFRLWGLNWSTTDHSSAITGASGNLQLQRLSEGWSLALEHLRIDTLAGPRPESDVEVYLSHGHGGGVSRISGRATFLRLEDLVSPLLAATSLDPVLRQPLAEAGLRGELHDLAFIYTPDAPATSRLALKARCKNLGLAPSNGELSLHGLTGELTVGPDEGRLRLNHADVETELPRVFESAIRLDSVDGEIRWHRQDDGWLVESGGLTVSNNVLSGRISGQIRWANEDESPFLNLIAHLEDADASATAAYLPAAILPPKVTEWLKSSLVSGRVTHAELLLHGRTADFPFDEGEGRFEVRGSVTDAILDYVPGWPRLEEADAELVFDGRSMDIRAPAGKVLNAEVIEGHAWIADLGADDPVLEVRGRGRASGNDGLRILLESPLRERFAGKLDGAQVTGQVLLDLGLTIPLGEEPNQVRGEIHLDGNDLSAANLGLELEKVTGTLGFDTETLHGTGLSAQLHGLPVSLSVTPAGSQDRRVSRIQAQGRIAVSELAALPATGSLQPLVSRLEGSTSWLGTLDIPADLGQEGSSTKVRVESSLEGLSVDLPAPLGKTSGEKRQLVLESAQEPGTRGVVTARYGGDVRAVLAFEADGESPRLLRSAVYLGGVQGGLPKENGLYVTGDLPTFSTAEWLEVLQRQAGDAPGRSADAGGGKALLRAVDVRGQRVEVLGQWMDDLRLVARRKPSGAWRTQLSGRDVSGEMTVPPEDSPAPVSMLFDRLTLAPPSASGREPPQDPRELPALEFSCREFHLGKVPLGLVTLVTRPRPWGLQVDELKVIGDGFEATATGEWHVEGAQHRSSFQIRLDSPDLGRMLKALGYERVSLAGGQTTITIDASWDGAPGDFALERMNGVLEVKTLKGRLLDLKPGASRLLGLLSLHALPRRLKLDFSDAFGKGFTYDRIEGVFTIDNGDAYTNSLYILAPSARIDIAGRVGLATEDYDQIVTVTPDVSSGTLPIAGAIAGGPLGAAAGFLAGKLFGGKLDKASKTQYQVTGSWDDPQIVRLGDKADNGGTGKAE